MVLLDGLDHFVKLQLIVDLGHTIRIKPHRSSKLIALQGQSDSCASASIVLKDLPAVFHTQDYQATPRPLLDLAKMRLVFRFLLAERLLLGLCTRYHVTQLSQLSCLPVSVLKLHRSFAMSFSSISLFRSALLGHVVDVPVLD